MNTDENIVREMDENLLPVMADTELSAIRDALNIVESVLSNIGKTNICSSADIADSMLDLRNLLVPLLR